MKILVFEKEIRGTHPERFQPFLKSEAKCVWELQQKGIIREIYFRQDQTTAVLIMECESVEQAENELANLPLVKNGLIEFDIIVLKPYLGFSRLFSDDINKL